MWTPLPMEVWVRNLTRGSPLTVFRRLGRRPPETRTFIDPADGFPVSRSQCSRAGVDGRLSNCAQETNHNHLGAKPASRELEEDHVEERRGAGFQLEAVPQGL